MHFYKIKKLKLLLMIFLLLLSCIIFFFCEKNQKNIVFDKLCLHFHNKEKICLNESNLFHDKSGNIYYFPIDKSYLDKNFYFTVKKHRGNNYFINNEKLNTKTYKLNYKDNINYKVINNNEEIFKINIRFTNLPIINIDINDCIDDLEREAFFEIFGPYGSETRDLYLKTIMIRKRGGSSRMFPKTPYRIQFFKSKKFY